MQATNYRAPLREFRRYAPGLVIGAYFLSLQFSRTINLSFLILLVGLATLFVSQPEIDIKRLFNRFSLAAILLFVSTLISAVFASRDTIGRLLPLALMPGLLIFLIVALFIRNLVQTMPIVVGHFLGLLASVWQFFAASYPAGYRSGELVYHAAHPLFLAPNDVLMFAILLPLFFVSGELFNSKIGSIIKWIYLGLLVGLSELLLSRVAMGIVFLFVIFFVIKKMSKKSIAVVCGVGLIAFLMASQIDGLLLYKLHAQEFDRLRLWAIAWKMFLDAPILGHGPGSFTLLYDQYQLRYGADLHLGHDLRHMGWSHNLFFEAMAERGIVGVSVLVVYFFVVLQSCSRKFSDEDVAVKSSLHTCAIFCLLAALLEMSQLRVWAIYVLYLLLALCAAFSSPLQADGKRTSLNISP